MLNRSELTLYSNILITQDVLFVNPSSTQTFKHSSNGGPIARFKHF